MIYNKGVATILGAASGLSGIPQLAFAPGGCSCGAQVVCSVARRCPCLRLLHHTLKLALHPKQGGQKKCTQNKWGGTCGYSMHHQKSEPGQPALCSSCWPGSAHLDHHHCKPGRPIFFYMKMEIPTKPRVQEVGP